MSESIPANVEGPQDTYILTMDLGERLERFRHIGLEAPGSHDDYTRDIQRELDLTLVSALPNTRVEPVYMQDLADTVLGAASKICQGLTDPVIVSTCNEMTHPTDGVEIEVNRLVDSKGRSMGVGPRPGRPSIERQIARKAVELQDREVVVVEDGIFSGATIMHLVRTLRDYNIKTAAVVVGFNCRESNRAWMDRADYEVVTTNKYHNVVDWVPDHDFLPFIPGSGKVLGVDFNGKMYPFYDSQGASYAVPYIRPFGPTAEWASIPPENVNIVSDKCFELARTIFRDLERQNPDTDITVGKLLETRRRTSIPLPLERDHFPTLDTKVVEYLDRVAAGLAI